MKTTIIYHSHSGTTRGIAQKIQEACDGDIIEVKLKEGHSSPVAYFIGLFRSLKHESDPIEPEIIDVSSADVVVIGTPVWTRKATPAIKAAVEALKGCRGKNAVLFATCRSSAGDTLPVLANALAEKGVRVAGEYVFDKNDVQDRDKIDALIAAVKSVGGGA